eukprot:TRINITY_DN6891_c0_g1_i1.p1 TRINITY_DN6891_c0_g1~~TRINITY_DN6891_c0_g1_i1.p1  ORF type:complete len:308 (+),score=86.30 TRINITY_DN6891_c0_g1_i1:40-924(+)
MSETYFVIGHATLDRIIDDGKESYVPGGGVYYSSLALSALNHNVTAILKRSPADNGYFEIFSKEVNEFIAIDSEKSTVFQNIHPDPNNLDLRVQLVPCTADPWTIDDLEYIPDNSVVLLSPLWYGEFPEELFESLKKKCRYLAMDIQGFTRHLKDTSDDSKDKHVEKMPWEQMEKCLQYVDLLKVDHMEASLVTGIKDMHEACLYLNSLGPKVLCTYRLGCKLFDEGQCLGEAFWTGLDTVTGDTRTGRGDTTIASLLQFLQSGLDAQKALDETAKIVSIKMHHKGPLRRHHLE